MMPLNILLASFMDKLLAWDTWLFLKINKHWTNPFLDDMFPWYRDSDTWVPLYLFLLVFMLINFGRKAWIWVAFFIANVALTDQVSAHLFKHLVGRARPCADVVLQFYSRLLLGGCSGGYSFPSSHAANHFGMATFIYLTLKPAIGNWGKLFFIWAATISYGQIYVGVHYPLDVLGGTLIGCAAGYLVAFIYNNKIGLPARVTVAKA